MPPFPSPISPPRATTPEFSIESGTVTSGAPRSFTQYGGDEGLVKRQLTVNGPYSPAVIRRCQTAVDKEES